MAHKSVPTQGKGRRPIIGYNNEKFRANYDSIFKKVEAKDLLDKKEREKRHQQIADKKHSIYKK